jgi:hypothetical protein
MLKYIGGGAYILGVPARDLNDDEEKEHAALIKEEEKTAGVKLYEKAARSEKGEPVKGAHSAQEG